MKLLGIISISFGIIAGAIIAIKGRVPDAIAGAIVFIGLGIYFLKKANTNPKK